MPASAHELACDVIVVGSGAAGLSAALAAAVDGAKVIVLEKAAVLGGTTAMSSAGTWVPANHHMLAAGLNDSAEETLTYLRATAPPGWAETEDELWQALAENSAPMLRFTRGPHAAACSSWSTIPISTSRRRAASCSAAWCRRP